MGGGHRAGRGGVRAGNDGASIRRSLTGLATSVPFDAGLAPGLGLTISVDRGGGIVYLGGVDGLYRLGH
jgi:hypothetical protein